MSPEQQIRQFTNETEEYVLAADFKYVNNRTKFEIEHVTCGTLFWTNKKNLIDLGRRCPDKGCVKRRKGDTLEETYGVRHQMHSPAVLKKIAETNIERYGSKSPFGNKQVQEKASATMVSRYGAKNTMSSPSLRADRSRKLFGARLRALCVRENLELISSPDHSLSINLQKGKFRCLECKETFERSLNKTSEAAECIQCRRCKPRVGTSLGEQQLADYVVTLGFEIERHHRDGGHELDIYLPTESLGIEFNGTYWHSEFAGNKDKQYHKQKQEYYNSLGIDVLYVWEHDWRDKQAIIKNIIASRLGKVEKRVTARECSVVRPNSSTAREFYDSNHLQGFAAASKHYGLEYCGELIMMASFGSSRFEEDTDELIRLCSRAGCTIVGGSRRLLVHYLRGSTSRKLVSYCDKATFSGGTYERLGFSRVRETAVGYQYVSKDYRQVHSRQKFMKRRLKKLLPIYDGAKTELENMLMNGYDRIWNCGNIYYELENTPKEKEAG